MNDVTRLQLNGVHQKQPCVEVKGSRQFIQYLLSNLNTTTGYPLYITNKGCYTEVYLEHTATWLLKIDDTLITGYAVKLL